MHHSRLCQRRRFRNLLSSWRGDTDGMGVYVGWAAEEHLAALVAALGQERFFRDCLNRQDKGEVVLLVAWMNGDPVGDVLLQFSPADEPEVRERLPGVPLLIHLEVHERYRRRGIGTQLIAVVEALAMESGHNRIALKVGADNVGARRLYERLGYTDWGHGMVVSSWEAPDTEGRMRTVTEVGPVLVRNLT